MFDSSMGVSRFSEDEVIKFDLMIYSIGYEARSRYVAQRYASSCENVFGFIFPDCHELSFEDNLAFAREAGVVTFNDQHALEKTLREAFPGKDHLSGAKILVDVSSMSRTVVSAIVSQLLDSEFFSGAEIAFVYAVANFTEPSGFEFDFLNFEPIGEFAGWTSAPEKPLAMVLGLGYEADHALGAVEYLDPSATFCFFPKGSDGRFADAVEKSNEPLLSQLKPSRVVRYPVSDPLHTFSLLSSILQSMLANARFVLVPMGPKIFVALCLVCQRIFGDEVSVWRASGHSHSALKDVDAEGPLTGFWVHRI